MTCKYQYCNNLSAVSLPKGLKSIKKQAFQNCPIETLTIPALVEYIYAQAFAGNSSLEVINALPVNPPFIYSNTFSHYDAELNVPSGSAEAYRNANYWKNFSTINDGNIYHELTVTASGNGTVGCHEQEVTAETATFDVKEGDDAVLTLTPDAGYSLASLTVNGEDAMEQVSNGTLTLSDVRADMTVVATFALVLTDEEADLSQIADAIYIEPTVGCAGRTVTIDVKMKNSTLTPVGCSFTLTLPDRLRLQTDEDGDVVYALGDRAKKLLVTIDDWDNGTYDFTLIPTSNKTTITGTDDTFITFTLPVPADMAAGDYRLGLTNGMIQTRTGSTTTDHPQSDVLTRLTIAVLGDANGDGSVTPADAIMILYAYFGVEQANFNRAAADLNGDKDITPADAIEALYRYFGAGGGNSNTRSVHPTTNGGKDPE